MKSRLVEINQEYENILHSDLDNYNKDLKFSKLMTTMEREFKIPLLKDKDFESKNPAVISLYLKISKSRSL